jgi:sterol desaturase/sphingolipid hydroxylase (fatty acid hydroxylase superfamily)
MTAAIIWTACCSPSSTATVGLAMGVEPSEFTLLGLLSELVQNFSHANVRLRLGWLGRVGERCW